MSFDLIKQLLERLDNIQVDKTTSSYDVARAVLKVAAQIAQREMDIQKTEYEKKMDDLDEPFDYSLDHLATITEDTVNSIVEQLADLTSKDYSEAAKVLFKKA